VELRDHSVLIVEDEFLTAIELEAIVRNAGAEVIGPALSAPQALLLIDNHKITVAILDVWLNQRNSLPVARRLADRGIPFVFHTGDGRDTLSRGDWPRAPVLRKPVPARTITAALAEVARR
jgi:two-component system, response regulator PdtaR